MRIVLIRPFACVEYAYQSIREGKSVSPRNSIFVIDDDPSMIRSIERVLKVYGFDVKAFESAEAFLDHANPSDARCLVLDINLSGMSGIELRRKLALSGISVPVIFITGNDSEIVRKAAVEVGFTAYLLKPFPAKHLMDAIGKALDGTVTSPPLFELMRSQQPLC